MSPIREKARFFVFLAFAIAVATGAWAGESVQEEYRASDGGEPKSQALAPSRSTIKAGGVETSASSPGSVRPAAVSTDTTRGYDGSVGIAGPSKAQAAAEAAMPSVVNEGPVGAFQAQAVAGSPSKKAEPSGVEMPSAAGPLGAYRMEGPTQTEQPKSADTAAGSLPSLFAPSGKAGTYRGP